MEGKILGIDSNNNVYTIKNNEGTRYNFSKDDWKSEDEPSIGQKVDFAIEEGNKAIDVFLVAVEEEISKDGSGKAIVALLITIFLGFIGTAITRFGIMEEKKKDEFGTVIPTLVHFICDILIIIPVIGWIIALCANIYFAIQNYKATKN